MQNKCMGSRGVLGFYENGTYSVSLVETDDSGRVVFWTGLDLLCCPEIMPDSECQVGN